MLSSGTIYGGLIFLLGAGCSLRAYFMLGVPGELPVSNAFPLIVGVIAALSGIGVMFRGTERRPMPSRALFCRLVVVSALCLAASVLFPRLHFWPVAFTLTFALGLVMNGAKSAGAWLTAALVACACSGALWLFYDRVFHLVLP